MPGPPPKPAHLRARTNRKAGAAQLEVPSKPKIPAIPNPDGREWHPLTISAWKTAFSSPMASEWLDADVDALGRLALLWDSFYHKPNPNTMKEIRLQGQLFGLSPLDRSRLQWEINKADESEQKAQRRAASPRRTGTHDPRAVLGLVKG
jgi:hypothetical protein